MRSADKKLQDVVDKIFPEMKKRDERLEKEFYEMHNFKRRTDCDDAAKATAKTAPKKSKYAAPTTPSGPKRCFEYSVEVRPFEW